MQKASKKRKLRTLFDLRLIKLLCMYFYLSRYHIYMIYFHFFLANLGCLNIELHNVLDLKVNTEI